jgi:signal transduction histidine kinase
MMAGAGRAMADNEDVERLRRQLVEAHKMASLGWLLASIVHEINTPIGSIFSNNEVILRSLEMLRQALEDPQPANLKRARELLSACQNLAAVDKIACERISSVIRGLKTFARGDSPEMRRASINEILSNTLKLTQGEFKRRITVETHLSELPDVECHPHLLSQVFLNVLVNAGQAIEGEGTITVRTRLEGACVHVSIADTGRGMTAEQRQKVFSAGFTTKPVGVGTGLGLPISRQIIQEVHGGSIGFESELGMGTTFHIRIPVR